MIAIKRRDDESGPKGDVKPVGSTTDPDARHMKDKECQVKPSYNLQMAVDSEAELIVAHEVSDAAADSGKLLPIVNQIEENVGFSPSEVSADQAYHMGSDLENLEKRNVVTYIPEQGRGQAQTPEQHAAVAAVHNAETLTDEQWKALPTAANKKISRDAFVFNADADTYTCPMGKLLLAGKVLVQQAKSGKIERTEYRAEEGACVSCPRAALCCENPEKGRMVTRDQYEPVREKLRQRMATEVGREKYKQRMHLAETPNAVINGVKGIYRFLRRGFTQVRAEASIMMAAYNIRILMKHLAKVTAPAAALVAGPTMRLDTG